MSYSIFDLLEEAYTKTYVPDGIDPLEVEWLNELHSVERACAQQDPSDFINITYTTLFKNSEKITEYKEITEREDNESYDQPEYKAIREKYTYLHSTKGMLSTFFGIPNRIGVNLFDHFIGWDSNISKKEVVPIFMCFIFTWNLFLTLSRFLNNILKLVTEFLPNFIEALSKYGFQKIELKESKLNYLLFPLVTFAYLISKAWAYFGRMITSPGLNIRLSFYAGLKAEEGNVFAGICAALFTSALTVIVYMIIFPLVGKLLLTKAAPFMKEAATHLPHAIQALKPTIEAIGNIFAGFVKPLVAHQFTAGLGFITAFTRTIIGPLVSAIHDKLSDRWHTPAIPSMVGSHGIIGRSLGSPEEIASAFIVNGAPRNNVSEHTLTPEEVGQLRVVTANSNLNGTRTLTPTERLEQARLQATAMLYRQTAHTSATVNHNHSPLTLSNNHET